MMRLAICVIFAAVIHGETPEQRAIDYLGKQVPRWFFENKCYSCHNNGDAARALYIAKRLHHEVPPTAFVGTSNWLTTPVRWDHNRGNPAFSDRKLARIQFAAALAEAWKSGATKKEWPMRSAARLLVADQSRNGSWPVEADTGVGSPATWGTALATYMARGVLEIADRQLFRYQIADANRWLEAYQPIGTFEAAVKLLALPKSNRELVEKIVEAESSDGGWGPRAHAPSEPFDTALVLLALHQASGPAQTITRGREYLISIQEKNGGWPETTRPPDGHSYAQHISTSGWALQALLVTSR